MSVLMADEHIEAVKRHSPDLTETQHLNKLCLSEHLKHILMHNAERFCVKGSYPKGAMCKGCTDGSYCDSPQDAEVINKTFAVNNFSELKNVIFMCS